VEEDYQQFFNVLTKYSKDKGYAMLEDFVKLSEIYFTNHDNMGSLDK